MSYYCVCYRHEALSHVNVKSLFPPHEALCSTRKSFETEPFVRVSTPFTLRCDPC